MSKKFYQTVDFKALNQEWKQKLKESGFQDIENCKNENAVSKQYFATDSSMTFTEDYADHISHILSTYNFKKPQHRRIIELHAEGKSASKIRSQCIVEFAEKALSLSGVKKVIKTILKK